MRRALPAARAAESSEPSTASPWAHTELNASHEGPARKRVWQQALMRAMVVLMVLAMIMSVAYTMSDVPAPQDVGVLEQDASELENIANQMKPAVTMPTEISPLSESVSETPRPHLEHKKIDVVQQRSRGLREFRMRHSYLESLSRAYKASGCQARPVKGILRPDYNQVCCFITEGQRKVSTCLPSLVVMGAQKGGTTALHSYLMLHPQLNPPRKKELHIFDIDRNFNSWPNQLKVAFRVPKQPILTKQHESISFESTPSYIASTLACERMSTFLSPWTVYVLILRDPVKRLWSEYNMKARRIQNQDTTLQSLFDHADDLAVCWTPTENDDDAVDGAKSKDSSGDSVPPAEKMRREHCQEALDKHLDGSRVKASQVSRRMVNLKFAMDFKRKCVDTAKLGASIEESRECARKLGVLRETLPDIRQDIIQESKSLQPCVDMAAGKQFSEAKVPVSALPWTAREQECQGKLKTRICPQCVREADSEGCVAKCFSASNGTAQELAIQMGCTPPDVGPYPSHKLRSPSACSGELCTCYPKAVNMADISKNFLWRGLYYPQIQQCLRYIPRSQLLIVDNDDLRRDPASVLGKITNELGLRDAPYGGPGFTYADASNEFSRKYPEFASTTGWSEDGSSSVPMPEDIELMLRSFYATPNKMLFDLIGKKFDHWL